MHRNRWVMGIIFLVFFGSLYSIFFESGEFVRPFNTENPKKRIKLGLDLQGGMNLMMEVDESQLPKGLTLNEAVDRAVEVVRNRVDQIGVSEPLIQKEGTKWIVVQLPGVKNPDEAKKMIGQTALLEFKLVDDAGDVEKAIEGKVPKGDVLLYDKENKPFLLKEEQLMTGASLANAKMSLGGGSFGSEIGVDFSLTDEGSKIFSKITGSNINKRLAIILDNRVISAPTINSKISRRGQITGNFDDKEAKNLALLLRSGSLPVPMNIISENVVGPSLGADSIKKGLYSGMIGLLAVLLIMGFYYKFSGVIADIGLLCNTLYLMGGITLIGATLTMPGIAGIILTIGMSVDSNVLILERIREELRTGKTVRAAVDAGYNRAFWTVIDSHVTTLITALILFVFGTGPIKGFAVTLSMGCAISLFTAVVVTKVIFDWRLSRGEVEKLSI
ncbi:MAG: protein-export membrane protein SecD [Candidatus Firestonebacteria bacterium RifOxyC12_full_39_7]|nr:MAG: protein-export membrane protein SecD [Candidatus Firestonebacteria bacterium RifOxyC12_full_39_7]